MNDRRCILTGVMLVKFDDWMAAKVPRTVPNFGNAWKLSADSAGYRGGSNHGVEGRNSPPVLVVMDPRPFGNRSMAEEFMMKEERRRPSRDGRSTETMGIERGRLW